MKGFVFSISRRRYRNSFVKADKDPFNALAFIRKHGSVLLFTFAFAAGLLWGSIYAQNADKAFVDGIDFLFTTNLESRLNQPVFSTFAASFASDFLFFSFVFLCGFAPWGIGVIPVAPAFKGFGTGVSAGYLFAVYGFKGIVFYLLVILGGTFLFSFALIMQCVQSQRMSILVAKSVFLSSDTALAVRESVRGYLIRSMYLMALTLASALVDMMLWTAFADMFFNGI